MQKLQIQQQELVLLSMWPLDLHRHNVLPSNHQKRNWLNRGPMHQGLCFSFLHGTPQSFELSSTGSLPNCILMCTVWCVCQTLWLAIWCECQTVRLHLLRVCQTHWLAIWCVCQTLWLAVACVCQTLWLNLVWMCQTIWRLSWCANPKPGGGMHPPKPRGWVLGG